MQWEPANSASERPPGAHYKWYVVAMLWWISFFNYADRQALFAVFKPLETEMGLTKVELGMLGSAFAWLYGLSAPFAGMIVDRVRRKAAILWGLYVWSIICMATALSQNFRHLFFFRAAEGLGETFYYPAANSMVSDYHGRRTRSRALGLHQTSVYAGTIGGGTFAGLISLHYGWRASFIVFGGLGILLGVVLHRFLREPPRGAADLADGVPPMPSEQRGFGVFLHILRTTPTIIFLMLAFMCANFVAAGVILTWMPSYLTDKFGLDLAMAGWTATIYVQLASFFGASLGGVLADRLRDRIAGGRMLVQALGVLGGAPFVFWCGQTLDVVWLVVAMTGLGLFKGLYDANIFASAFDVVRPEARGTTAGFMNMIGWLVGGASAPVVVGYLAQEYDFSTAISSTALVYLAAFVFLLLAVGCAKRDVAKLRAGL